MAGVRLEWDGKRTQVDRQVLPLQVVETVNVNRRTGDTLDAHYARDDDGWRNRLVWGDNAQVLPSLAEQLAGQVDLVYIDPPFDSRQDYTVRIGIGDASADQQLSKLQSVVEEKAYRDTWGSGVDSYLQMLYTRLVLLKDLLSDRGSIFLHLAPNVSHYGRLLLEEVFGPENLRAEVAWKRTSSHSDAKDFAVVHDAILVFSKTQQHIWNAQYEPYDDEFVAQYYRYDDGDGRLYWRDNIQSPSPRPNLTYEWRGFPPPPNGWRYSWERMAELDAQGRIHYPDSTRRRPTLKRYLDESKGMPVGDVWTDVKRINQMAKERLGYDTQKPEALLERIIRSSSDEGSIVLDCFAGSGTTAAVAEKLGRRWVACDIGRFAVHTTRKRLLDIPGCRPFTVANLGRYERQVWQRATTGPQVQAYLDFVVELYHGERVDDATHLHGRRDQHAVHVGAVDAPVSAAQIKDALDEAAGAGYRGLDVLGWEWEMGLHELVQEEADERGVALRLRRIPREVMDPRERAAGVVFHELAYVKVNAEVTARTVRVTLTDFVLANPDLVPDAVRDKITSWSDYVDYWAVDFAFGTAEGPDTFHNQWQSYRTRAQRRLDLTAPHAYETSGHRRILVKVVDVFGNDTTTAVEVDV